MCKRDNDSLHRSIPSVYREGYQRAARSAPEAAATYVRHTMVGDPAADAAVASLAPFDSDTRRLLIQAGIDRRKDERSPLNEGRSLNSGDTCRDRQGDWHRRRRSTKAGV